MPNPIQILGIILLVLSGVHVPQTQTTAQKPAPVRAPRPAPVEYPLQPLIDEAIQKSAELAALQQRIRATEARESPAGALPDPMASITLSNVPVGSPSLSRTPMSGVEIGLRQDMPRSSKRRLRRAIVGDEAAALQHRYDDKRNEVTRMVKQAYYQVQYIDEAIRTTDENKSLAEDFLAAAEARYATGSGIQQDVFRAQVRLSQMIDALISLGQQRDSAVAGLNALLFRPQSSPIPTLAGPEQTSAALDGEQLRYRTEAANPRLAETRQRIDQAGKQRALAKEGIKPDFSFGVSYRLRDSVPMDPVSGTDFWSASASMTLPWVHRKDKVEKEVEAAKSQEAAAGEDLTDLRNQLSSRIEDLLARIASDEQQISLVDTGLLPQAEGALASSRTAYETGRVEFLTLLDNQTSVYNLELQRSRLIADHEKALAELEQVVGGPLKSEMVKS